MAIENMKNGDHDGIQCCFPKEFPPQHQEEQPGMEYIMRPLPMSECCKPRRKLESKVALVTGGDSGIGRAVVYDYVKEGAKVAIVYYDEDRDARETSDKVREMGGESILLNKIYILIVHSNNIFC